MRKASSGTAAGKKTNTNSSSTMKRKETGGTGEAIDPTPPSLLPKKGRYKDDKVAVTQSKMDAKTSNTTTKSNGPTYVIQELPQKQVQFTFGALPNITDAPFKATIVICKRSTLQQMFNEGDQLINAMLGLSLSANILQSMYTDCGGGSTSKGISVASTYVDHATLHKLYFMTVPDTVSRYNHAWSVHSISDAIKAAVGGSQSTCCRIICCGMGVAQSMGSLTASMARAFSVFTRKTKTTTLSEEEEDVSPSPPVPPVPRIHISFMDVSDSGIQESIPTENGDHLRYICESIQLTARLVDMVRYIVPWICCISCYIPLIELVTTFIFRFRYYSTH